jgi:hypothetical protein
MYSTCLFCHASLGANEVIEHLPIGRRIAFDADKGRLWVVCRKCERWNLTPLEERWEAIEECVRAFGETKLRVSTDNIGLARLREGLELVRIGAPQRPELAAWRYGDQFGRRRRRYMMYAGLGFVGVGSILVVGGATGILTAGAFAQIPNLINPAVQLYTRRRVRARLRLPGATEPVLLRGKQLSRVSIVAAEDGWNLRVPYALPSDAPRVLRSGQLFRPGPLSNVPDQTGSAILTGDEAVQVARQLLPTINAKGARASTVSSAVDLLEETPDARELFGRYTTVPRTPGRASPRKPRDGTPGACIMQLPAPVRLALEMIANEESERRALEGELAELESAWRDAEEIAAIADDMFLPEGTAEELAALKRAR